MKKMFLLWALSFVCVLFINSEEYRKVSQKTDIQLSAPVGRTIIKITKQRDLLNAFGKKDIFGGKVDEGFIELKYLGKVADSKFALGITEVTIESNETTMSRYGKSKAITNLNTTSDYTGNYITTGNIYIIDKPEDKTYVLPPDYSDFVWNFDIGKEYILESYKITFLSFNENQLTYIISAN